MFFLQCTMIKTTMRLKVLKNKIGNVGTGFYLRVKELHQLFMVFMVAVKLRGLPLTLCFTTYILEYKCFHLSRAGLSV